MSFGERIKEARKGRGFTQTQLAKIVGVAKTTISGYESGHSEPDEQRIIAIMRALEIDANYLWQDSLKSYKSKLPSHEALKVGFAFDSAPINIRKSIQTLLEPYVQNNTEIAAEITPDISKLQQMVAELKCEVDEELSKKQDLKEHILNEKKAAAG